MMVVLMVVSSMAVMMKQELVVAPVEAMSCSDVGIGVGDSVAGEV